MATPTPYKIQVSDDRITSLREKLALNSYPDELTDAGWTLGSPLPDVQRLAKYWQHGFDWRAQEAKLNELPQFRANVNVSGFGEVGVHFVHQKSQQPGAIPLLFVHGWPGSFIEVTKILPLLKGGTGPAFDIVAPSLPNYGFSDGIKKPGFALAQYAETCHKLMLTLGYEQYVSQGGDWGFYITRCVGLLYPSHCLASHINMVRATKPTWTSNPILSLQHMLTPYTNTEKYSMERANWFMREGSGYRDEQATKPQTLGYGLADSPVALLAWIYEKLHDWTDGYPWTDDEILTWISIYWFSTAGPAANLRIYYEAVHASDKKTGRDAMSSWIPGPRLGMAYFPKELGNVPKTWGRTLGPVVYESEHDKGGHFAAWERPDAIAGDLVKMFGKGGPCAGIIRGRTGYAPGAKL